MKLLDFIAKGTIIENIEAADKTAALRRLVEALRAHHTGEPLKPREAVEALLKREKVGSTGLGQGVAVPHAKIDGLKSVLGAFGRSKVGIDFSAPDGELVHLVFMVLSPFDRADVHVDALRSIAESVKRPNFRSFARQAKSSRELFELFQEVDQQGAKGNG
ncbi:MAG: PTS sugar transporter subunit IIA [Planctomycetes bacterium]|nr:PTS sugar transporter subunit IIA [Planctomycetota bacterium]